MLKRKENPLIEAHEILKEKHPHIARKVKKHFKYKYPKLTLLLLMIIVSYMLFRNPIISSFFGSLGNLKYLGVFSAGLLFSCGFTTPIALGIFFALNPNNILVSALIGGFGAFISDFLIFGAIKTSFMDEFNTIKELKVMKKIDGLMKNSINVKLNLYLTYLFAGLVIASPLPDEIGVVMLSGLGHIKPIPFAILSLFFNTLGITIMLLL